MMDLDWLLLAQSLACLGLAGVLLVLEIFIVSFGLLLLAAIVSACAAIYFAFQTHVVIGWVMLVLTPIVGLYLARFGIDRIKRSKLIPREEISAEAGYHQVAESIGAQIGETGVLETDARPTGRARFSGGACDVQMRYGSLDRGKSVTVERIDGPVVYVVPANIDLKSDMP